MGGSNSREEIGPLSNPMFFSPQELKDLECAFELGAIEEINSLIQEKVNNLKSTELHIAVTGEAGVGKSTFINAFRGLRSSDEGAAKSGNTERTMKPTQYKHPNFDEVSFWDLPGIGTTKIPFEQYFSKMKFELYNFFIIISSGRFTKNDASIAQNIKSLRKNFYFVRSKIDNDLRAHQLSHAQANNDAELTKIRDYCTDGLRKAGISEPKVFLISSFQVNDFDFPELKETLANNLDDIRKDIFLRTLPSTTSKFVEQKRDQLKNRTWILAAHAVSLGAVPIPGMDIVCDLGMLVTAIEEFREFFGLDDASLQRLANVTGKPVEVLKSEVKTSLAGEINKDLVKSMLLRSRYVDTADNMPFLKKIPIIGPRYQLGKSQKITENLLNDILSEFAKNAQRVVDTAFDTD
ncbi:interferon-inducible GTPase 5-like [Pristis pectinata]|uniref:interferon-inducible GTPase 5-like n=1 Tax=Pristis pectinata TaxID=685728 RepID=UPI00223C8F1D|nr:interferon-inducible GTPase 5-like [Pristis pectinata]